MDNEIFSKEDLDKKFYEYTGMRNVSEKEEFNMTLMPIYYLGTIIVKPQTPEEEKQVADALDSIKQFLNASNGPRKENILRLIEKMDKNREYIKSDYVRFSLIVVFFRNVGQVLISESYKKGYRILTENAINSLIDNKNLQFDVGNPCHDSWLKASRKLNQQIFFQK